MLVQSTVGHKTGDVQVAYLKLSDVGWRWRLAKVRRSKPLWVKPFVTELDSADGELLDHGK